MFYIFGWFAVPINPDKWSSTVIASQEELRTSYLRVIQMEE